MAFHFKQIFEGTQAAFKDAPAQSSAWFEARTQLGDGVDSTATVRQFSPRVDEPPALGGKTPRPIRLNIFSLRSVRARKSPTGSTPTRSEFRCRELQ